MGYEINRFHGDVDEELICPICSSVLEEPVQAPDCEHAFCYDCISQWLKQQPTCPVDRQPIYIKDLKPVPRILKNLLSKLMVTCDNSIHGCDIVVKLESLSLHLQECDHNPKKPVECSNSCGMIVPKDELQNHNCIKELRKVINDQQNRINQLTNEVYKQKNDIDRVTTDLRSLEEVLRIIRTNNYHPRSYVTPNENTEVSRWSASLPIARVTRWGGIISTPDAVLQAVIKRALTESGCPTNIINDLMDAAHEKHWPPGLSTLESRQLNRRYYESFICKRIPNKQAVVILNCDNRHMENNLQLICDPGICMIFAHGIE